MIFVKHGIVLDPVDAAMLRDLVAIKIDQMKQQARAEKNNPSSLRGKFAHLFAMKKRLEGILADMRHEPVERVQPEPEALEEAEKTVEEIA